MHSVICILFLLASSFAHYHGYESRNVIEREEPHLDADSLVQCPVCEIWQDQKECTIDKGDKKFKRCLWDTYYNEQCGKLDCYRGPGETCTEKMENDIYGQRCAHGCYCDGAIHQCVCVGYEPNHYLRHYILSNPLYRYPISKPEFENLLA